MSKITFFVMSEKGFRSIKYFLDNFNFNLIDCIVYASDQNVLNDFTKDIIDLAKQHRINYFSRKDKYEIKSKYIVAISWKWLIKLENECILITIHDSLLPKYRGFAPLVNQLLNKEPYIGVTAIISSDEYDKGDIITQFSTKIEYPIKLENAITIVSLLYEKIIHFIGTEINFNRKFITTKQLERDATYSLWRDEFDYKIDWNSDSESILNFIYAVGYPYLGAYCFMDNQKIRILDAEVFDDLKIMNRDIGKIIFFEEKFPVVVCGKGLLKITIANYEDNNESIFPLNKFRIRFT